jgi:hypothetical protein
LAERLRPDATGADNPKQPVITHLGDFVALAPPGLRRIALAVAVLHDIDVEPRDGGVILLGSRNVYVSWSDVSATVDADGAGGDPQRIGRLARWLRARCALAAGAELHALGMPTSRTPAPAWSRESVPGGALCLGFGYGEARTPVPDGVLEHAGIDAAIAWRSVRADLERIGELAAGMDRRRREGALRPVGGADVVTLLGARSLRTELAAGQGDGMVALVVPLRTRGWRATAMSDPVYGQALAAAMPADERGFERPLLATAEELSEVATLTPADA